MSAVIAFILNSRIAQAIGAALAAMAGLWAYGRARERRGRQRGAEGVAREAAQDTVDRVEQGNEQVADNRGDDPDERVRRNDGKW